ncbi:MAG TPA: phosphopantetheine-binding protein [Thermoleophilaceae bacterium]|nr:phosphopantetheine-binding protein [Thermoleophilaceae bacterium]
MLTASAIRDILLTQWPARFPVEALGEEVPLGEEGLGLDSIELVELVLACEEQAAREANEELFRDGQLTIRSLVAYFDGV